MIELLEPSEEELRTLIARTAAVRGLGIAPKALPPRNLLDAGLSLANHTDARYRRWGVPLLIHLPDETTVVGSIGGKGLLPEETKVEIGYNVAPPYRGRGIGTAAVAEILRLARADGLSLVAHVQPHNEASRRVLQRNGFRLRGRVRLAGGPELERWLSE